jgi:cell division protein FtsW
MPSPGGGWDLWLVVVVVGLLAFGVLTIQSASALKAMDTYGNAYEFVKRQLMGVSLGVVIGAIVLRSSWKDLRDKPRIAFAAVIVLLIAVLIPGVGREANGAQRWIALGGINFQPSALAKLTMVMAFADFLARHEGRLRDIRATALGLLVWVVPAVVLVGLERDFGNVAILVSLAGLMIVLAGLQWRWVIVLGSLTIGMLAMYAMSEPYRMRRLTNFMDPMADPEGDGYQVTQGWIALASGNWFGRGPGEGVGQRGFLPEAHTDFVSAVVGEEWGAVGWVALVLAYIILIYRGTVIASRAPDLFGTLAAWGCTALLGAQAIINLGMVTGVTPAKGAVLPFMSFGASEVIVHVVCIAILLRIGLESHRPDSPQYKSPGGGASGRPSSGGVSVGRLGDAQRGSL